MNCLPPKQKCLENMASIGCQMWRTWEVSCIYICKGYFFQTPMSGYKAKKKFRKKKYCGIKNLFPKQILWKFWCHLADKYGTNKQLQTYTLINATFSKSKIQPKIEKILNFEKSNLACNELACQIWYQLSVSLAHLSF